jgi:hypothetical protein
VIPFLRLDRAVLIERVALAGARLGLTAPPWPAPFFDATSA